MICLVDTDNMTVLPSPDELQNKIIIKAKRLLSHLDSESSTTAQVEALSDESRGLSSLGTDEHDSLRKIFYILKAVVVLKVLLSLESQEPEEVLNSNGYQETDNGDTTPEPAEPHTESSEDLQYQQAETQELTVIIIFVMFLNELFINSTYYSLCPASH